MIVTSSYHLFAQLSHVLPRGDCHAHQNGSCIFPSMTVSFLVARDVVFTVFQFFMGNSHGVMFWRFVSWLVVLLFVAVFLSCFGSRAAVVKSTRAYDYFSLAMWYCSCIGRYS